MAIPKSSKVLVVILVVVALSLTLTTLAVLNVNQNINSSGNILTPPNIGVFSDSGCTINMTSINWGSVTAGGTSNVLAYVKNTGSGTLTLSSIAVSGWNPSGASTYLQITWNQTNTQLSAGQVVTALFTLTVSSSVTGINSFNNNILVSGSG